MGKNCKGPLVSTDGCTFTHTFTHSKAVQLQDILPWVEGFDPTMVTSETTCGKVLFDSWKDEKWVDSPGGQGCTHKNPAEGGAAVGGCGYGEGVWISMYLYVILYMYIMYTYTSEKNTVRFGSTQTLKG